MTDLTQITYAQITENLEMHLDGAAGALSERCYLAGNLRGARFVIRLALSDLDQADKCLSELERRESAGLETGRDREKSR